MGCRSCGGGSTVRVSNAPLTGPGPRRLYAVYDMTTDDRVSGYFRTMGRAQGKREELCNGADPCGLEAREVTN